MQRINLALLALSLAITSPLLAGDIHWTAAVDGNWSDGANWSGGSMPAPGDNVFIDAVGDYTVTLDTDAELTDLALGASTGSQRLSASSRTLTIGGTATISANGEFSLAAAIVAGPGSLVNGGTITLQNNNTISADLLNDGTLNVEHQNNQVTGQFSTTAGTVGTRTIDAGVRNQGTIAVDYSATLSHASDTITNQAAVTVAEDQVLTVSGSFAHTGGNIVGPGWVHFSSADAEFTTAAFPSAELRFTSSVIGAPAVITSNGVLTLNNNNTVNAAIENLGTVNVHHANNLVTAEFGARVGSLLNLEIVQNANPQITFEQPFTNYGTIEMDQAIA